MDVRVPIPKQRPSPLPRLIHTDIAKKPIPLPRQTLAKEQVCDNLGTGGSTHVVQCRASNKSLVTSDILSKPVSILKEELPLVADTAQEKEKYIAEGIRKLSLISRKSTSKRHTVRPSPNKDDMTQIKPSIRSRSLPSEDIFQSITFSSPLPIGNESDRTMIEGEEESDDENRASGAPPPVYPPPPLPDESVYDEVQSVISNHSSNHSDSRFPCIIGDIVHGKDALYEAVSLSTTDLKLLNMPKSLCSVNGTENSSFIKTSVSQIEGEKPYLRSDSWRYYDTASGDDEFRSVIDFDDPVGADDTLSSVNLHSKDSVSCRSNRTVSCSSISPSFLSDFDGLGDISGDDAYDDEHSSTSPARSSTSQSICKENELYDNWEPKMDSNNSAVNLRQKDGRKLPSKSVIIEFDPLYKRESAVAKDLLSDKSSAVLLLNTNTKRDSKSPYGKINRVVTTVILEDFEDSVVRDEVVCPPVPPRRYDSISPLAVDNSETVPEYVERVCVPPKLSHRAPKTESVDLSFHKHDDASIPDNSVLRRSESVNSPSDSRRKRLRWRDALKATTLALSPSVIRRNPSFLGRKEPPLSTSPSTSAGVEEKVASVIERPVIAPQLALSYSGMVFKVSTGRERQQDFLQRWCVLAEDKLTYYSDKSATNVRDVISLNAILSVHVIMDYKISTDGDCYEFSTAAKGRNFVFGTSGPSERRVWMQKILESLTMVFPMRIMADYTRAGWCFVKEGISGAWSSAWLLVHKRTLFYCLSNATIQEVDLKKARCIVLQDSEAEMEALSVSEKGPLILLDHPGQALYLRMDTASETAAWQKEIRSAAVDNGPNLAQQQLTRDDIPCIVDKCINFVYAHGSMSEGIYRRNGANSSVTRLLEQFRLDAWAVQLSRQEYTEYDVSNVLKRFFRDLPEPLLTTELHGQLCDIAAGKLGRDRLTMYRRALEQLPPTNFLTTRKLIGHLHFIHEQHEKNLMPVENLAAIWGPTLMHVEVPESVPLEWSKLETTVVANLITMYTSLFGVGAAELDREKRMQEVLERYHSSISSVPQSKQSGELHVWVYLHSRDSNNCINITIGPQKLAGEVCTDLCSRLALPAHELSLQEVICSGALVRPLHYTEKVLDVVLRWGYWDDVDRKDNCLVLTKNDIIKEVVPLAKPPLAMCGDLQFADQKSKSFKHYLFEFSQAKLCYYNHKRCSVKLNEWKIEDIVWYLGHEPKRNPQLRWTITFIEKNKKNNRTKDSPYFGCAIAGVTKEEQLRWMAALLIGEHPQGLLPSPVLLQ